MDAVAGEAEEIVGGATEGEGGAASISEEGNTAMAWETALVAVMGRLLTVEVVIKLMANASQPTPFLIVTTTTTRIMPAKGRKTTQASRWASSLRLSSNTHLRTRPRGTTLLIPARLRPTNSNPPLLLALKTTNSTDSLSSMAIRRPGNHLFSTSSRLSSNSTGQTISSSTRSSNSSLRERSSSQQVRMSIRHSGQASSSKHRRSMVAGPRSSSNTRSIRVRVRARVKGKGSLI